MNWTSLGLSVGDFNTVECQEDKEGTLSVHLPAVEEKAQLAPKADHGLYDPIRRWCPDSRALVHLDEFQESARAKLPEA